jgi:hypothetical protein
MACSVSHCRDSTFYFILFYLHTTNNPQSPTTNQRTKKWAKGIKTNQNFAFLSLDLDLDFGVWQNKTRFRRHSEFGTLLPVLNNTKHREMGFMSQSNNCLYFLLFTPFTCFSFTLVPEETRRLLFMIFSSMDFRFQLVLGLRLVITD